MELVILSGKGGTGKTTIGVALAQLAQEVVGIDCDVDAANMYLYYQGEDIEKQKFYSGKKAVVHESQCTQCGQCQEVCHFGAIQQGKIDLFACEGCGACTLVCPQKAIALVDEKAAQVFVTQLEKGMILSRAEMEIGSDGSGKLVTQLRTNGRKFSKNKKVIIVDGSPGIGCPVIASMTGSDAVLLVAEPTLSGLEDIKRVITLCEHFQLLTLVCINKYDMNEEISRKIESFVHQKQLKIVGKIPYDETVIQSINELSPIVTYENSIAAKAIEDMWEKIKIKLGGMKNESSHCK
ncbi:MAG: 4Fe-4S binding protein [Epulopiscium sp.]|nr:4Fe-4S binding protein [Candidatus Epulonipiscium sp.]